MEPTALIRMTRESLKEKRNKRNYWKILRKLKQYSTERKLYEKKMICKYCKGMKKVHEEKLKASWYCQNNKTCLHVTI